MIEAKQLIRRGLRAVGIATLPPLDARLAGLERVFRAPPLTKELVTAIARISPQFQLSAGERSREFWEVEQNGACWGEYEALLPLFAALDRPHKVLEIGPGLGRSVIFFAKKLGWESSEIHLYEGTGATTYYTTLGPRFDYSFCGDLAVLSHILRYNGVGNVTIFDAKNIKMADLAGPYNFIYSFFSIGFHWALENFIDDILGLMDQQSVAVFTVPAGFTPFARLNELSHRVIDWKAVWPAERWLKLLIIGKSRLPHW